MTYDWILFDDDSICVVNKPSTLPTQPDLTGDMSLLSIMETALQQKLYIVHRLDRVASGIVVLAKNEESAALLSQQFQRHDMDKKYLAIVENEPPKEQDTLVHFLKKNAKTNSSKAFGEAVLGAKRSELSYILRGYSVRYFLLEIQLLTGRHHQIRAQLKAIGCSIKGDVKYGAKRSNKDRAIHLHAWQLQFIHPKTQAILTFKTEPPTEVLWDFFKSKINTL